MSQKGSHTFIWKSMEPHQAAAPIGLSVTSCARVQSIFENLTLAVNMIDYMRANNLLTTENGYMCPPLPGISGDYPELKPEYLDSPEKAQRIQSQEEAYMRAMGWS